MRVHASVRYDLMHVHVGVGKCLRVNGFFCHIRSCTLRLRQERTKGPFAIKLNDFVSQIGQFEEKINFDFMDSLHNLESCIKSTFKLINLFRNHMSFKSENVVTCCDKSNFQNEYHMHKVERYCPFRTHL